MAAALQISAGTDRIDFFWTPLILGVVYLLAATIDGPAGGYWATALGLTGWGVVDASTYAITLAVVGALNVALGAQQLLTTRARG